MIKVFYDGKCGLCLPEIRHYQRIALPKTIDWIDLNQEKAFFETLKFTKEEGLRQFHVIDENGNIHVGIPAFIKLWQKLPYWFYLAKLANIPFINFCLSYLYKYFADWRYRRLYQCKVKKL